MNSQTATNLQTSCAPEKIVLYVEGELAPSAELEMENHVASCRKCLDELNSQKQLLRALDFVFDARQEIELPENFARVVAARAESRVTGLRCAKERGRALFLCVALFLLVLAGLGAETEKVFAAFGEFLGAVAAVAGFVFHLVLDVSLGTAVVLRALGSQFFYNSSISLVLIVALLIFPLFLLSRLLRENHS